MNRFFLLDDQEREPRNFISAIGRPVPGVHGRSGTAFEENWNLHRLFFARGGFTDAARTEAKRQRRELVELREWEA
jgi:hypothetical protein